MSIRLKKEIMRIGDFQKKDGTRFTITPERLQHWKEAFDEMKSLQINVPVCKDHQTDVDHTVGTVNGMETDGSSLYAILEFPDERFVDLTMNNGVSIAARPVIPTGVKTFEDAIEHIALTSRPMIPGLKGYSLVCSLNDADSDTDEDSEVDDDSDESVDNEVGEEVDEPVNNSANIENIREATPKPKQVSKPKRLQAINPIMRTVSQSVTAPASVYALQRAMDIVSDMFGIPIPAEATRTEEAAIVFLSTVSACNKAGMVQKQTVITASANKAPEPTQQPPAPTKEAPQEPTPDEDTSPQDEEETEVPDDANEKNLDEDVDVAEEGTEDGAKTEPEGAEPEDTEPEGTETETPPPTVKKKKRRTPGEDSIVASLNDYRKMQIETLAHRCGIPIDKMQTTIQKFCVCDTQDAYFSTLGEFEAFRGGLECSLNGRTRDPAGLLGTWTGTQTKPPQQNSKPIFEQRGELRENPTK